MPNASFPDRCHRSYGEGPDRTYVVVTEKAVGSEVVISAGRAATLPYGTLLFNPYTMDIRMVAGHVNNSIGAVPNHGGTKSSPWTAGQCLHILYPSIGATNA